MENIIFHICKLEDWSNDSKYYSHISLKEEGFIHMSTVDQVAGVLQRYFENEVGIIKLSIDSSLLEAELIYEKASNGEFYPHLYGKLNKSAVIKTQNVK